MTQPDPLIALQSEFQQIDQQSQFDNVRQAMDKVNDLLHTLPDHIAAIRSRGYAFAAYLEHKVEVLSSQWADKQRTMQPILSHQAMALRDEVLRLRSQIGAARAGDAPRLTGAVSALRSQVESTSNNLLAQFQQVAADVTQTDQQVKDIGWMLDQRDQASFPFLAGENLFLAAKAEYAKTGHGKDDPDGVLYLTDQRLIFEEKETTGKTLGLFGGKKTQQLIWAVALHDIDQVKPENKGLFGGKDLLHFTFKGGAPVGTATVEVKGGVKSQFWAAQITRMVQGGVSDERAIPPDAETLKAIQSAPTACHVCGATLPALLANEHQVECKYCGAVIRV